MTVYVDTSALLRVVLREPAALDDLREYDTLVSSELIVVESSRTIDCASRACSRTEEAIVRQDAVVEWFEAMDLVLLRPLILSRASEPLPIPLGTLDALHLASALIWRERMGPVSVVATHDTGLGLAARAFGFEGHVGRGMGRERRRDVQRIQRSKRYVERRQQEALGMSMDGRRQFDAPARRRERLDCAVETTRLLRRQVAFPRAPPQRRRRLRQREVGDDDVLGSHQRRVQRLALCVWYEQLHQRARVQIDGLGPPRPRDPAGSGDSTTPDGSASSVTRDRPDLRARLWTASVRPGASGAGLVPGRERAWAA